MARTPETLPISAHTLMLLLNYRWAAVNSEAVGELGEKLHEDFVSEIDAQSSVEVSPEQLADLIHHMREVLFERVRPRHIDYRSKNHNIIMRALKKECPHLFKELPTGEVVMHELEDRNGI